MEKEPVKRSIIDRIITEQLKDFLVQYEFFFLGNMAGTTILEERKVAK